MEENSKREQEDLAPEVEQGADEASESLDEILTEAEPPVGDATEEPAAEAAPEPTPLEAATAERDELKDRWLRAVAELDNVRKRSRREVTEARRFAQADILRSLLDVADNFERALASMDPEAEEGGTSLREGVTLIHQRFQTVLKDRGVETIEALETEFDPNCHETVGQAPREDTEHGTVIEVVQQGYRFGDMVLRPARVIIAS